MMDHVSDKSRWYERRLSMRSRRLTLFVGLPCLWTYFGWIGRNRIATGDHSYLGVFAATILLTAVLTLHLLQARTKKNQDELDLHSALCMGAFMATLYVFNDYTLGSLRLPSFLEALVAASAYGLLDYYSTPTASKLDRNRTMQDV